jgi:hypothetical protein
MSLKEGEIEVVAQSRGGYEIVIGAPERNGVTGSYTEFHAGTMHGEHLTAQEAHNRLQQLGVSPAPDLRTLTPGKAMKVK